MVGVNFFGNFDLASAAIWGFWLFFAGLIYYIQRENMREGFPLEDDDGKVESSLSWSLPKPKTFKLPHGRGEVTVPSPEVEAAHRRDDLALVRTSLQSGMPFEPTGNPLVDGVGAAAWTPRRDEPELTGEGEVKIRPLSQLADFHVSAGIDPRGLAVVDGEGEVIGRVVDLWVDVPESLVRFLTVDLNPEGSGRIRVLPINLVRVKRDRVVVQSLFEEHFEDLPAPKSADQITLLEEEKITAYVAGGKRFASEMRNRPAI